jgi:hypothetical protein
MGTPHRCSLSRADRYQRCLFCNISQLLLTLVGIDAEQPLNASTHSTHAAANAAERTNTVCRAIVRGNLTEGIVAGALSPRIAALEIVILSSNRRGFRVVHVA